MAAEINFSVWDYLIFGSLFAGTLLIGLYHAWKSGKTTTQEYLVGSNKMSILPVSASLISSHFSAVHLLGLTTEVYYYGATYILFVLDGFFGALATVYIYLPVFYEIQCVSIFEYFEQRFNKCVQLIGTIGYHAQILMYLSFGIYAPALIASQATGLTIWTCVLTIGLLCTLYTALGGIRAVMWTDTFQCAFMLTSVMAVIVIGFIDVGEISHVWEKNLENDKFDIFNFDTNPAVRYTVWTMLLGNGSITVSKFSVSQPYVQRYLSTPTLKTAKWTVWLNYVGSTVFGVMTVLAGLILYGAYWDCDPFASKKIESKDQILSFFVFQRLTPNYNGLAGLFAAGLISCAISTVSSCINSLATVTYKQIIQPYCTSAIMKKHPMFMIKLVAIIYGLVSIVFVPVIENMGGILSTLMTLMTITNGPAFGVFTLGMLFPRATSACALVGIFFGAVIPIWIFIGGQIYFPEANSIPMSTAGCDVINGSNVLRNLSSPISDINADSAFEIYKISFLWYRVVSVFFTIFMGVLVSFLFGLDDSKKVDPKLICPIVHSIAKWRKSGKSKNIYTITNTGKDVNSALLCNPVTSSDTPL